MIGLDIRTDIDRAPWTDLAYSPAGELARIARIPKGTATGASAVAIAIKLPDGTYVIGQTTLALLACAVGALKASESAPS